MLTIRTLTFSLLALALALLSGPVDSASPTDRALDKTDPYFPQVNGRNVDGRTYRLPEEFERPYNLVLLAFTQQHQLDVNTWLEGLRSLEAQYSHVGVYELPTLPEFSWIQRRQVDFWMSAGISDPLTRQTTITLYTDVDAMRQALQIANTSTIRLFLVDRQGQVYWQGEGSYSEPQFQELSDVVLALQG